MLLYTTQLWMGKKLPEGFNFLDTTVKNNPNCVLAPTWPIVVKIKGGIIDAKEYTKQYREVVWNKTQMKPDDWETLLRQETLTVSCFCAVGQFCHRIAAIDILRVACQRRGIPFNYGGELTKENYEFMPRRMMDTQLF